MHKRQKETDAHKCFANAIDMPAYIQEEKSHAQNRMRAQLCKIVCRRRHVLWWMVSSLFILTIIFRVWIISQGNCFLVVHDPFFQIWVPSVTTRFSQYMPKKPGQMRERHTYENSQPSTPYSCTPRPGQHHTEMAHQQERLQTSIDEEDRDPLSNTCVRSCTPIHQACLRLIG